GNRVPRARPGLGLALAEVVGLGLAVAELPWSGLAFADVAPGWSGARRDARGDPGRPPRSPRCSWLGLALADIAKVLVVGPGAR
ncbi:MAG TPA: hypothetical protein VGG25_29270, partial [Streptosporangiaceae bacterium]